MLSRINTISTIKHSYQGVPAKLTFSGCFFLSLMMFLTACTSQSGQAPSLGANSGTTASTITIQESVPVTALDETSSDTKITPEAPSFEPDTLYSLMLAEIAAQRNRMDVTLSQYVQQAHDTRDLGIVIRANRIARYMGSHKASLSTSTLWVELEPESIEARQVVITELLHYRRYPEAIKNIDRLLDFQPNLNFDHLIENTQHLMPHEKSKLIEQFKPLTISHKNSASTWFTYALLLKQNKQYQEAMIATEMALSIEPAYASAMITKGSLISLLGDQKKALKWLKNSVKQLPDNSRLRLIYARMLINTQQYTKAQKEFSKLVEQSPNNGDLILSLAILTLENDLPEQAETYLKRLIEINQRPNDAHFFLGELHRSQNRLDKAISEYRKVKTGNKLLTARAYIATSLGEQGQLNEARQSLASDRETYPDYAIQFYITESGILANQKQNEESLRILSEALQKYPGNPDILYNRAMLGEKLNQLDLFESDLRTILKTDPNNAMALNALGYTLANRSERLTEALGYISRAIEINPGDPAIMDSMGWVQYRLGNYDTAIKYLEAAISITNDHEIAAHLGEVLWVSGKKDEARKVWSEALKLDTDSQPLIQVINKYDQK